MTHHLKEIIGLTLTFACIIITTAEQVDDRSRTIPNCGHLSAQEDQYNFFLGTQGQKCCMCWKGTYLVNECSVNDPNSTRCDACEYDSGKQTFVDFEPHTEQECKHDSVSCMSHLLYVPGSPSSPASCVCPSGTVMVNERVPLCQPMSNDPLTTPSPTTSSTLQYTTFSPSSSVLNSETTFPQDTPATLESIKEDFLNTVDFQTSATPISASTGGAGFMTTLSNTTAADQDGLLHHIMSMINIPVTVAVCLASMAFVTTVVMLCFRYFARRTFDEVFSRNPVEDGEEKPYNTGISDGSIISDSCKKIGDPLLDGSQHVSLQIHTNEHVQNRNWVQRMFSGCSRSPGNSALWKAVPPDEPNLPNETGDSGNQGIGQPPNPRANDQPAQERDLRFEALMDMAEVIEDKDLCTVGRYFLERFGKREFGDIYYCKDIPGRAEKARIIFLRAMSLNPGLSLQDIRKAVEDLGYLGLIVDKKIALL